MKIVISILTTGNILHESSSAPRQHKSVQYKLFTLHLHRDVSHTDMLQLQCTFYQLHRGFGSRRQHAQIQGFLSVLFSPQRILQFTEGVQCCFFSLRKLYLYFTKDPEGVHYFPGGGGGVKFFPRGGPNAYFFRNPCTFLLFSRGWGVWTPYSLWIRTWAMSS